MVSQVNCSNHRFASWFVMLLINMKIKIVNKNKPLQVSKEFGISSTLTSKLFSLGICKYKKNSQTMICLEQIVILAVMAIALFGRLTEAGFRCSVVGGFLNIFSGEARSAACSASCVTLGHASGICASDGECQ